MKNALNNSRARSLLFALLFGINLISCVQTPVDGQAIKNRQAQVSFSGTHSMPTRSLSIQALNNSTGSYVTLGSMTSTNWAMTDSDGTPWYGWSKNVSLPQSNSYWTTTGSSPNRQASITTRAYDPTAQFSLYSFDLWGSICLASYIQEDLPGTDMVLDCATGNTVKLRVMCGDKNEPCCPNSKAPCSSASLVCEDDLCVKPAMVVTPTPHGPIVEVPGPSVACTDMVDAPCMFDLSMSCNSGIDEVRGKWACENGRAVCKAAKDIDYCRGCDDGLTSVCGKCPNQTCVDNSQCSPGNECKIVQGSSTKQCKPIPTNQCDRKPERYCYLPWQPKTSPPVGSRNRDICE